MKRRRESSRNPVCSRPPSQFHSIRLVEFLAFLVLLAAMPVLSFQLTRIGRGSRSFAALSCPRLYTQSIQNDDVAAKEYTRRQQQLRDASKLSLAPMMDYTDRHFRHLVRLISNRTLLYTEMVAANAIAHERQEMMRQFQEQNAHVSDERLIRSGYDDHFLQRYLSQGQAKEGASVLQLGGSCPDQMFAAAQTVLDMIDRGHCDYTAINLNCGCPSPKVAGKGCFGAALMDHPALVAELTTAIHQGCEGRIPVTVKCRVGTDLDAPYSKLGYAAMDPETEYRKLCQFIETVAGAGVVTDFQVHARIAVLSKSFSPAENRKVPPLKYDLVRRLVQDYPELTFSLNGGVNSISQAEDQFEQSPGLAGVMVGRAWAAAPWDFAMADHLLYGDEVNPRNRINILEAYGKHADHEETVWDPVKIRRFIVKAVTQLFAGEPNAKRYRIALDEIAGSAKKMRLEGKSIKSQPPISELILTAAYKHLDEEILLRTPEESYHRTLYEERKQAGDAATLRITEWQYDRKLAEARGS